MTATIIILAAGMGSRFGGPKQLVPVGPHGDSILDFNVRHAIDAGFERVVIVTRAELLDRVEEVAARAKAAGAEVAIALQHLPPHRAKPYGSAEAVATAAELVDAAFGVANADDLYGPAAFGALAAHVIADSDDAGVVAFRLGDTVPNVGAVTRAVMAGDGETVSRIIEVGGISIESGQWQPEHVDGIGALTGDEPVSMNLLALPRRAMAYIAEASAAFVAADAPGEIFLPELVGELLADGMRVRLLTGAGAWAGLTNPEDLEVVREHVRAQWPGPIFER